MLLTCKQFEVDGAPDTIRRMLPLIFAKDQGEPGSVTHHLVVGCMLAGSEAPGGYDASPPACHAPPPPPSQPSLHLLCTSRLAPEQPSRTASWRRWTSCTSTAGQATPSPPPRRRATSSTWPRAQTWVRCRWLRVGRWPHLLPAARACCAAAAPAGCACSCRLRCGLWLRLRRCCCWPGACAHTSLQPARCGALLFLAVGELGSLEEVVKEFIAKQFLRPVMLHELWDVAARAHTAMAQKAPGHER